LIKLVFEKMLSIFIPKNISSARTKIIRIEKTFYPYFRISMQQGIYS